MQTNATDNATATALSDLADLDQGTVFSAIVKKMGVVRGGAHGTRSAQVYGDDEVQVLLWTGFSYRALIERSFKMLNRQIQRGGYIERLTRATLEEHEGARIEDACEAIQETRDWFRRKLASPSDTTSSLTHNFPSVWEPLMVEGVVVRGARVYVGAARRDDPRIPVPGTIYISGVKLGEVVVTPAANGPWMPDSKPKTVAKRLLRESLPVGLYCQYRLAPERVSQFAVGRAASRMVKGSGISIDPEALRALFKIAP